MRMKYDIDGDYCR